MDSFKEWLYKSEPVAWGLAGIGLIAYPFAWTWFDNKVGEALTRDISNKCGVNLARDEWKKFRKDYRRKFLTDNGTNGIGKSISNIFGNTKNPITLLRRLRGEWKIFKNVIGDFGKGVTLPLFAQEIAFWVGGGALEVDVGFSSSHLGGNFFVAAGIAAACGFGVAQLRRLHAIWYISRDLRLFGNPDERLCRAVRDFKRVPEKGFTDEPVRRVCREPDVLPATLAVETGVKLAVTAASGLTAWEIFKIVATRATVLFGLVAPPYMMEEMRGFGRENYDF